eukprot:GDKI01026271.1.p1 GENE.GDKI01026271.1~~GDKI01026271.1.p1  ORF type:complete len:330 (-),score=64.17 GDKI01026271.1:110-1099(-)
MSRDAASVAGGLTAPLPALVAYFADLMGTAKVGAPQRIAADALVALRSKLDDESRVDTAVLLVALTLEERQQLHLLACGGMKRSVLQTTSAFFNKHGFLQLIDTVCQPNIEGDGDVLQLLPPYGALLRAMLNSGGKILIEFADKHWKIHDLLARRLKRFGELGPQIMSRAGACISTAILKRLADNGIGIRLGSDPKPTFRPPATLDELKSMPSVIAIFKVLNTQEAAKQQSPVAQSQSVRTFASLFADSTGQKAKNFMTHAGVHILVWLRHIEAHTFIPQTALAEAGLWVDIVDDAAEAAVDAWKSAGWPVKDGLPDLTPHEPSELAGA